MRYSDFITKFFQKTDLRKCEYLPKGISTLQVWVLYTDKDMNNKPAQSQVKDVGGSGEQLKLEHRLVDILSRLVGARMDDLSLVYRDICELTGAQRLRLFSLDTKHNVVECLQEWVTSGKVPLQAIWKTVGLDMQKWLVGQLWGKDVLSLDVENLPAAADSEKDIFQRQGIEKAVVFPIKHKQKLWFFVQLDNVTDLDFWQKDEERRLFRLLADGLGHVLIRERNVGGEKKIDRFKSIFESIDQGVVVTKSSGVIEQVNRRFAEMVGLDVSFLDGKSLVELEKVVGKSNLNEIRRSIQMVRMGSVVPPVELEEIEVDGEQRQYECRTVILFDHGDQKSEYDLLLFSDISIRKEVDQAVRRLDELMRQVVEQVNVGMMVSDEKGKFEIFNQKIEELTGYSQTEANEADDFAAFLHSEQEMPKVKKILGEMNVGEGRVEEVEIKRKDSKTIKVWLTTKLIEVDGKKVFVTTLVPKE